MTPSAAYDRFVASMKIGYNEWHDGIPYDLDALGAVTPDERTELEAFLLKRKDADWRDAEALAKINSSASIQGLKDCLKGPNREVRLRAAELLYASSRLDSLEPFIVEGLHTANLGDGLAQCERLAAAHPSDAVKDELLHGALNSKDGRAVRFVGILFFLYGKADVPFYWGQRDFFLRFKTNQPRERRKAFHEMCQTLGIDGSKFTASPRPWWRFWD